MPSILIPPGFLKPAPKEFHGTSCATCDRPQASWELTRATKSGDVVFLCSPCVLHRSPFASVPSVKNNLQQFIADVEESMGRPLARDAEGFLQGADADRVVFSIVLFSNLQGRSSR